MSKTVKVYGVVKALKKGGNDLLFAQVEDLNTEGTMHILCSGSVDNSFGDNKVTLKEGMRIACDCEGNERVLGVMGKVKVYPERKKGKDNTGMEIGHALNSAFDLTRHKKLGVEEEAKALHEITATLKKEWAEKTGQDVNSYDLGASVGHAIRNACCMVKTVDEVHDKALKILEGPVAKVTEYVKSL